MEAEVVAVVHDGSWRRHVVCDVGVLVEELLETKGRDVLDFLLEDLVYGVTTVLEDIDQVHNFLFSEFEVGDLICEKLTLTCNV